MTTERKVEEFLEIESLASKVAEELTELRKEAENHVAASQSFSTALARIEDLSKSVGKGADELAALSKSMREGVLPEILQKTEEMRKQMSGIRQLIVAGVASVALLEVISIVLIIVG